MDLHQLLDLVEDAPDHRGGRIARQLVDVPVGQQVDVELGPDALDHLREEHAEVARCETRDVEFGLRGEELAQQRHVVLRRDGEAVEDHHRLELAVEDHGEKRVLEAADDHRLVDHLVLDAPQTANLAAIFARLAAGVGVTNSVSK